jgi:hypothetical protein
MAASVVRIEYVGGPHCGRQATIELQKNGRLPSRLTPKGIEDGSAYRLRPKDAATLVNPAKTVRFYDWAPASIQQKPQT